MCLFIPICHVFRKLTYQCIVNLWPMSCVPCDNLLQRYWQNLPCDLFETNKSCYINYNGHFICDLWQNRYIILPIDDGLSPATTAGGNETDSDGDTKWITKVKFAAGAGLLLAAIIVALIIFVVILKRRKREREGNKYYIIIYIQICRDAQT